MTIFVDGNLTIGVEATMMALATGLIARRSAPAQIQSVVQWSGLVFLLGAIPALWMIIQLLPLGYFGIANPVWETTQQTLGYAVTGSIEIDTGAGLIGLIQYVATVAMLFVSMAVTLDRSRADGVLFALVIATTIACLPIANLLSQLNIVIDKSPDVGVVRDVGVLGVLLAVTAAIRAIERWQSSRSFSTSKLVLSLVASIAALAVCGLALAMHWAGNLGFGLAFALTVLLAIPFIRWLGVGSWGAAAFAAVLLTVSVSLVWIEFGSRAVDLMFSYSDNDALEAITKRILSDAPWFGSGVGSFETLVNVYQQPGDILRITTASTAAAKIAIELGRPMLWTVSSMTILAIAALLRGALRRGRDSFYPALGASCLIALLIRGFGDASIFAQVVSIVAAATLGLALAQSRGQTTR
jgi:hypothetical protein